LTRFFFPGSIRSYLIPEPNRTEIPTPRPTFLRRFGNETWIIIALLVLGAIMMASNPWFTPVDDEIVIIDVAARPAFTTVKLVVSSGGQHQRPPLSDLLLHGWLWLTNGNIHWLRLPSVVFYLLGAWFLVQAARRMAGDRAGTFTLILLLLWPYGFHLGRLAGWYSFTFLLIPLLTLVYLKYIEHPSPGSWMPVVLCALALVYTNYFGWALMGLLGLDLLLRVGRQRRTWLLLLATGIFLPVASIPIMRAFITELHTGAVTGRASSPVATGIYNLYCLFVSESVAPWFWVPGIAAGLAIACVLLLVFRLRKAGRPAILFVFRGAAGGDDVSADCHNAVDADDQPVADSFHRGRAGDAGTASRATLAGGLADFGGRDWLVRNFLAQILRCAALDRALGPGGARGCASCG